MSISSEFGITSDVLAPTPKELARLVLARTHDEGLPPAADTGLLSERLRGVASAVSTLIGDYFQEPVKLKQPSASQRQVNPPNPAQTAGKRVVWAQTSPFHDFVWVGTDRKEQDDMHPECHILIPSDPVIDELLQPGEHLRSPSVHSLDYRSGSLTSSMPYERILAVPDDPRRYFDALQYLAGELLDITKTVADS